MNTFQITRDIPIGDTWGDLVLWTGSAVLGKWTNTYEGKDGKDTDTKWYDTKCKDRGTLIKRVGIVNLLLGGFISGRIPKDCNSIVRFSIVDGDMWQITTDKCLTDDDYRSYGDVVLWASYAKLSQDNGKWWDDSCRDRGKVIDCEIVRMFFDDNIPSWKDKEIFKFDVVIKE